MAIKFVLLRPLHLFIFEVSSFSSKQMTDASVRVEGNQNYFNQSPLRSFVY